MRDCIPPIRQAIATYRPWLSNAEERYLDNIRATVVLTVERKITWAERLRRVQAALVPRHSDFDSLKSILAKNRPDLLGPAVLAPAGSPPFWSTGQNHCDEVLAENR